MRCILFTIIKDRIRFLSAKDQSFSFCESLWPGIDARLQCDKNILRCSFYPKATGAFIIEISTSFYDLNMHEKSQYSFLGLWLCPLVSWCKATANFFISFFKREKSIIIWWMKEKFHFFIIIIFSENIIIMSFKCYPFWFQRIFLQQLYSDHCCFYKSIIMSLKSFKRDAAIFIWNPINKTNFS